MKIKFFTDVSFDNKRVSPRDIRNIIMSSVPAELADKIGNKNKEKHTQSVFVYPKPRPRSFELLSYLNDLEALADVEVSLVGKSFNLAGKDVKIISCEWEDEGYLPVKPDLVMYKTRTPIVISSNAVEHKIVYASAKNNNLVPYIQRKITEMIQIQYREFFSKEINLDDLVLKVIEMNKITVATDAKGKEYSQAVYATFMSNYRLPRFLGFNNGLGFGEIYDTSKQHQKIKRREDNV